MKEAANRATCLRNIALMLFVLLLCMLCMTGCAAKAPETGASAPGGTVPPGTGGATRPETTAPAPGTPGADTKPADIAEAEPPKDEGTPAEDPTGDGEDAMAWEPAEPWPFIPGLSDEELIGYLLDHADTIRERVYGLGMAALVTGETEELPGAGLCRLVELGTSRPDQFVREHTFAISEWGDVYEYDLMDDFWHYVNPYF